MAFRSTLVSGYSTSENISVYLVLFLLPSFILSSWALSCPFTSDSDPCKCSPPTEDMTITCRKIQHVQLLLLMDKLRNFKHLPATHLEVISSNLTGIGSGVFRQLNFRSIHFERCSLSMDISEIFSGIENTLDDLQFRWCEILLPLSGWTLGHLPKLKRLAVTHSPLPSLPRNLLDTPATRLQSIYFYGDGISDIESGALLTAFSLQVLYLNDNKIRTVNRSVLPRPAAELVEIHLRNNEIEHLSRSIWEGMPRLRLVDVSSNNLHALAEVTWTPVWRSLTDIYIQGNPLHCDCEIRWLIQEESKLSKLKKFTRILYGSCSSPDYLRYKELENLTIFDLPC